MLGHAAGSDKEVSRGRDPWKKDPTSRVSIAVPVGPNILETSHVVL